MQIYPNKPEFQQLATKQKLVPIWTVLPADLDTPISLYNKLVGEQCGFLLESAEQGKCGRFSIIGCNPYAFITVRKNYTEIKSDKKCRQIHARPLVALKEVMAAYACEQLAGLPPYIGGPVGYFAYELAATWERIRTMTVADDEILAELMLCRFIIVIDKLTNSLFLINWLDVADLLAADAYDQAARELRKMAAIIDKPLTATANGCERNSAVVQQASNVSRSDFITQVEQAREYIAAGDIFQVVLSQKFCFEPVTEPFALFRRLRRLNPSPYMFYLNYGKRIVFGASPERLVKVEKAKVFSYPIAGTRPRGRDEAEDAALAAELIADEKERAEHAMLVDLARNDIGRVSQPGTVRVERSMEVEKFSHVMHLVSEVTGQLAPNLSPLDVLAACFPAGTVSGAPKVRAMEIIAELEREGRGVYAGAVGYIDFRGDMDTCIAIRTVVVDGTKAYVQAGAGIVADSVPAKEYEETCHKAQALRQIIARDEP